MADHVGITDEMVAAFLSSATAAGAWNTSAWNANPTAWMEFKLDHLRTGLAAVAPLIAAQVLAEHRCADDFATVAEAYDAIGKAWAAGERMNEILPAFDSRPIPKESK